MKKKISTYFILIIFALLFTGCKEKVETTVGELPIQSLTKYSDSTKEYVASYEDARITPDYIPGVIPFQFYGDTLYFRDNTDLLNQGICKLMVQEGEVPERLPIDFFGKSIDTFVVSGDSLTDTLVYCVERDLEGNVNLTAYSGDGSKMIDNIFDEKINQVVKQRTALKMMVSKEGVFILWPDRLLVFDKTGAYKGEIECAGQEFIDMYCCESGIVYVTYRSESGTQIMLSKLNFQGMKLAEAKEVIGNGYLCKGQANSLLLCGNGVVYSCEPEKECVLKLFELKNYDVSDDDLLVMEETDSGVIRLVSWEMLNGKKPVEIITLTEKQEGDVSEDERQVVKILGLQWLGEDLTDVIVEFNKQSDEYRAELVEMSWEGDTLEEVYEGINIHLAAKESADILYLVDYSNLRRYQSKGYLEDLTPYLEQSEKISNEAFLQEVLECMKIDGKLYGISNSFCISTLVGKSSQHDTNAGWTVEEFLKWLSDNSKEKPVYGLSKMDIMECCLKGNMDAYVNWENGKVSFEEDSFKDMLVTVKELNAETDMYYDLCLDVGAKDILLELYTKGIFENYLDMRYGGEVVYKGYPNDNGTPKYYFTFNCLSMLSRSENKEGAYAFLEFAIARQDMENRYYSLKSNYEKSIEWALNYKISEKMPNGEWTETPLLTREQAEQQRELLVYAAKDTIRNQKIRSIVMEEVEVYLQDGKDLDETCAIIQNRVQLYVDENK